VGILKPYAKIAFEPKRKEIKRKRTWENCKNTIFKFV
jgi:hypothetical protein